MALKRNVLANFVGQGWRVLMSIVFVPLYIKYLGIEAYGLIGVFALLQVWLGMLDMGMKPALGREMARFTGGAHDAQSISDLLRSIEIVSFAIALLIAIGIWAAAGWLATEWVQPEELAVESVVRAFALMGAISALQIIESIYVSTISGLQRQVLQNIVTIGLATVRGLGAVGVLIWVSPTISAFFLWQGLVSVIAIVIYAAVVYCVLPAAPRPARFSMSALIGVWRYAFGMVVITFLALLLTQVDKLILSRLLSLRNFAYYALAGVVASSLYSLTGPIASAFYPRFTELVARGDISALRQTYHQGAQLLSVIAGSAAVVMMMFGDVILLLWTSDPVLVRQVVPIMRVLMLGTLFHGLMWIPYHLQLAYGWTALTVKVNSVAVCILVPAIMWLVPIYGPIAAAWSWVTLNVGYLFISIYFMHRRLLPNEKWRWYRQDIAVPLAAAIAIAWICQWAMPDGLGARNQFGYLVLSSCCVVIGAMLAAPLIRYHIINSIEIRFTSMNARSTKSPK